MNSQPEEMCECGHYKSEHFDEAGRPCAYCSCSSYRSAHNASVSYTYNLADAYDRHQEEREMPLAPWKEKGNG
jgi:hypothetical protein